MECLLYKLLVLSRYNEDDKEWVVLHTLDYTPVYYDLEKASVKPSFTVVYSMFIRMIRALFELPCQADIAFNSTQQGREWQTVDEGCDGPYFKLVSPDWLPRHLLELLSEVLSEVDFHDSSQSIIVHREGQYDYALPKLQSRQKRDQVLMLCFRDGHQRVEEK